VQSQIISFSQTILTAVSNYLYPTRCIFCHEFLEAQDAQCCDSCYSDIDRIDCFFCPKCGKKREEASELCFDCSTKPHYFESGRAMYVYEGAIKKSLFGLKFFHETWVGKTFGQLLAQYYLELELFEVDLVLPIPLHILRRIKRGYNQAEIVGQSFSLYAKLIYESNALLRHKWTKPQKDLTEIERKSNLENAFSLKKSKVDLIKGKRILLIDDIYTTGTTIDSCAKLLYENGANKVYFLTIAIGSGL